MLLRITIAIDKKGIRQKLNKLLEENDVLVQSIPDEHLAWESIPPYPSDILIVSRAIIPKPCETVIAKACAATNSPAIVILSENENIVEQAGLQAAGATAVLADSMKIEDISKTLLTIIEERRSLLNKIIVARRISARPQLSDFISTSTAMQSFLKVTQRVVNSTSNLLILGETGAGKERLARAIHTGSHRSDGPFISVNCGAVHENLIESELFGHTRGSFTGANTDKRGCFELAHNGVLFLDEITEMPLHLQVKLLHVLQDFQIRPVGSEKVIPVDVRVIAATNRNIQDEVEANRFRRDLYYRLSVVTLTVPPLRDRVDDIPKLVASFVSELSARIGCDVQDISREAVEALCRYDWPGNVRELINVLERAILLSETRTIELCDLPEEINYLVMTGQTELPTTAEMGLPETIPAAWLDSPLRKLKSRILEHYERKYLEGLLTNTGGRVGETARLAGIEPRSLFTKMKKYGLNKNDFKAP